MSEEDSEVVAIKSSVDFCKALGTLLTDKSFPSENKDTRQFIEAMQAWLIDVEGTNSFFEQPSDEYVTWADLYKILQAAAIYE